MSVANLAAVFALAVAPASAHAAASSNHSLCSKAYGVRAAVVKKHGKRAPGRNICRQGVRVRRTHHWETRPATTHEKAKYLRALKKLNAPPRPYLITTAGPPLQPPAATMSSSYSPTGLASCIVRSESGGNPMAQNGQYKGIAQWSPEAWGRMGGRRYASTPTGASYQEQLVVLSYGLAHYGCADWCPYDPC